jgi:hypothetical protein
MAISPEDFGSSFKGFLDEMNSQRRPKEPPFFARKLREHFGSEPTTLPIVSETFPSQDQPNIHVAMDEFLRREDVWSQMLGVSGSRGIMGKTMSDLLAPEAGFGGEAKEGPVRFSNVQLSVDRVLACIERAMFLIRKDGQCLAVYVREEDKVGSKDQFIVEVMATDRASAERFLGDLRTGMRKHNVYRGHVISLREEGYRDIRVQFHELPRIDRDGIILPEGLLARVERQTIEFGRHSDRLLKAGRHLRRGLLLHGPPGTGKTMTAMYLAEAMRERTALLMTGRNLGLLGRTCAMARALQPSMVILEDIDLIAEERTKGGTGCSTPLLFELLNEMDGLQEDADIIFILTTNRPDLLEPALVSRPGRIDQAIEIPLPDADCRRRLFELYGRGMRMAVTNLPRFISRTERASAAFIRELMRRAALLAVNENPEVVIEDQHLDAAMHDLVVQGGELTKSLLGFQTPRHESASPEAT